jgi:hypothetical protein
VKEFTLKRARELMKQQERRKKHRKGKAAARKLPPATVHMVDYNNA